MSKLTLRENPVVVVRDILALNIEGVTSDDILKYFGEYPHLPDGETRVTHFQKWRTGEVPAFNPSTH